MEPFGRNWMCFILKKAQSFCCITKLWATKVKEWVTNIKQEPENDSVTYKPTPMPSYNPTPLALLNQKKSQPEPDYSVSYQPTPLKEIKREKEKKVKQNWL